MPHFSRSPGLTNGRCLCGRTPRDAAWTGGSPLAQPASSRVGSKLRPRIAIQPAMQLSNKASSHALLSAIQEPRRLVAFVPGHRSCAIPREFGIKVHKPRVFLPGGAWRPRYAKPLRPGRIRSKLRVVVTVFFRCAFAVGVRWAPRRRFASGRGATRPRSLARGRGAGNCRGKSVQLALPGFCGIDSFGIGKGAIFSSSTPATLASESDARKRKARAPKRHDVFDAWVAPWTSIVDDSCRRRARVAGTMQNRRSNNCVLAQGRPPANSKRRLRVCPVRLVRHRVAPEARPEHSQIRNIAQRGVLTDQGA